GTNDTAVIRSATLQSIGAGEAFVWKAPQQGLWRVYAFNTYFKGGVDGGKVNVLDSRLAQAFIETALEPYARRLGGKLGKSIPGDFIDHEGDYGRQLAWSDTLDSRFKARHGRDIRLSLPLLLNKDVEGLYAKARWEWFDLVSDLYAATFQSVTDWHEQRGMYTTAHMWEESLSLQAHTVGDHMKLLRGLTMPAQDALGKKALQVYDFKEIESVAEFQNTRAATELMGAGAFGSAGNGAGKEMPWSTFTPTFLKQAVNAVTAWGMSHVIPHGVFTSRKLTGNPWPPDWYAENPMFPYMHLWTDFTRRASFVNSMGSAAPDVLLFNPMESVWMNVNAAMLDVNVWDILEGRIDGSRYHEINKVYAAAVNDLTDARVEFLVADRYYLKQMAVQDGRLVRGDFSFRTLVLPSLDILTLDAARKMVDFAKAGGRICSLGGLPGASAERGLNDPEMKALMGALKTAPSFSACPEGLKSALLKGPQPGLESPVRFVSGAFKMLQHRRRIDGKDFFWLANNAEQKQACDVVISGVRGRASIWDCETGEIKPVTSAAVAEGSRLRLEFRPLEAYWLVFDSKVPAMIAPAKLEMQEVLAVTGPWNVTFDGKIQPTMEFPSAPPSEFSAGAKKPLEDWKAWAPEKFSGLMDYTQTIHVDQVEKTMFLDLGKVCHAAEVWVNGQPVGQKLWGPYVYDVSTALRPGENEIRVRVANLINNSYGDIQESGLFGPVKLSAQP
ncbi:MAG: glycosyl hydrolase, partial [bacterium]